MFVLHTSNKTENLLAHLDQVLSTPLSAPFIKEEFIIQSQGMQRWLSQQLAERRVVWANFEFYFPGKFFGNIVDKVSPEGSKQIFTEDKLVWHLYDVLSDEGLSQLEGDGCRVLLNYMQGDNADLKRYQLAEKLAYLFDQYQFMRPDWLANWSQGKSYLFHHSGKPGSRNDKQSEQWQRMLWRALLSKQQNQPDFDDSGFINRGKGQYWISAIDNLSVMNQVDAQALLPERLCVFGINAMSPIYLQFLETIGQFIDVHFFLLNPSAVYWADLPNKRQLVTENHQENKLFTIDNPLLSSLGQQGRDFQQLLLEQCQFELKYVSFEDHSGNESNQEVSVLAHLQNDVLHNRISKQAVSIHKNNDKNNDSSISLHACHSRMREIEILKDLILQCLDENNALSLRDIVVMAPDVSQYAPYISAVFEDIPHAIADRRLLDSNDLISVFLRFLSLSQSRWELELVLDVLEQNIVFENFGLLEADLELIRSWLAHTHIRWGESAEHRDELGFTGFAENSWQAGIERLLMGYTNADDSRFCDGVLPFVDIEGSQAQVLGGLYDFYCLLGKAKGTFSAFHTLSQWVEHLTYFADKLLMSTDRFQLQYVALMEMISELESYTDIHQDPVPLDVILSWFNSTANKPQSSTGFLRGQLTFCSMLPMRAIPFKVIALVGMNEGEYPRLETHAAFDLMANHPRKGDKSSRMDERYQFLEILLSAQQRLIITYIGQSQKRNERLPPAVVVDDLMEMLEEYYQLDEADFLTYHPLQPFSSQYFSPSVNLFSYSAYYYEICQSLNETKTSEASEIKSWWTDRIPGETINTIDTIELHDLLNFYQHPQRHFLQQQLQINIPGINKRTEETEPFVIDGLSEYQISQEWVSKLIVDNNASITDKNIDFYAQLKAQGRWLNGSHAPLVFDGQRLAIEAFVKHIQSLHCGNPVGSLSVDIAVGDYRLVGKIDQQYEQGSLFYRFADVKGKDLLSAWVNHLVSLQLKPTKTWLISKNQQWYFESVEHHTQQLQALIEFYIQGLQRPSSLLVEPAMAWLDQRSKKTARSTPLERALRVYQGIIEYDSDLQLIYQGVAAENVINIKFEQACELLIPISQAGNKANNIG